MSEEDRNNFKTYMSKKKDFTDLIIKDKEDNYYYSAIYVNELQQEIERLNNIINELEKWLEEDLKQVYRDAGHRHNLILEVLDKLQELKGSDKE